MTAVGDAVEELSAAVPYLRITAGEPSPDREWFACAALVSDPDALAGLVTPTMAARGTDRDDVAMSLFVQAYAFRIGSLAIGAWVLGDVVVDVSPSTASIAIARNRPDSVHLDRMTTAGEGVEALHRTLVDEHLAPLVDTAHRACRVGERLLWSNVGASVASSFGMLMGPRPERRGEIRERIETFVGTAHPELARSGRVAHVGPLWAWERAACCLWYLTESGSRCEDCSLWTDDERQERYARVLAEVEADFEVGS